MYEEEGDAAVTPFFLNRELQGEILPHEMIDDADDEQELVADDEESSLTSPVEDEEDTW